ncbi:CHAT domain-containing protein [Anatilimnocola floriformis]|uniref:CHAT domain-containing protein n=1 Tax=Anatilimnocola floriformis TaxID=2948575 RepID=UPI0020C5311C|nr:CHAT domain-containing protein [Anatilimnocola floriformis]
MKLQQLYRTLAVCLMLAFAVPCLAQSQLDDDTYNEILAATLAANDNGRYKEAERYALQLKANDERFDPKNFAWRIFLGLAIKNQGRYDEARPLLESYVELCKKNHGEEIRTVEGLMTLGGLYIEMDLTDEAAPVLEEAVKMGVRKLGPDNETTLDAQTNLASVYQKTGEWDRAVTLFRDTINRQHRIGSRNLERMIPICNLTLLYQYQGRYEQAESIARYGLTVVKALGLPTKHPKTIMLLERLAMTYQVQHRYEEARPILEEALKAADSLLGADHPDTGSICANLSVCYTELKETAKARELLKRAIDIYSGVYGAEHARLCPMIYALAWDLVDDGDYPEAEKVARRGLAIAEKASNGEKRLAAQLRTLLADILFLQDKVDQSEAELKRALSDLTERGTDLTRRHDLMRTQARILWKRGDKQGAIRELKAAIELVDSSRASAGGSEVERAAYYSKFTLTHEILLQWQAELGDVPEAFKTFERARARTFQESIDQAGVDLWAGRSAEDKAREQQQQVELNSKVSKLQTEWLEFPAATDKEERAVTEERQQLANNLLDARDELYNFERDLRNASQAYRQLISTQPKVQELAEVQKKLVQEKTLLLSYFIGEHNSYVLAVTPTNARLLELKVSAQDAAVLALKVGPLTRDNLKKVLLGDDKSAVLPRIAKNVPLGDVEPKLHSLWQVLVPEQLRAEVTGGGLDKLIVVPDGPLSLLPLEALIVDRSAGIVYLLDVAPPIEYGPSAAVLMTLTDRPTVPPKKISVLTLGNPTYTRAPANALAETGRAAVIRSSLRPLPFTGTESRWVAETFRKSGAESVQFLLGTATEANIRANIEGREIIHLACHGSSDASYGNFFGALAVAPGQKVGNPMDDGMLTLAEINTLNLKGCELAILSACLTNHGPQQEGEGVWALSRGFLVAGARRVVASDWVVDDAAAGSLISIFCSRLALDRKADKPLDYSKALRDAKRWTRDQEKWNRPYFWAPFVFVGPR